MTDPSDEAPPDDPRPDNVVRVAFGAPAKPKAEPHDVEKFRAFAEMVDMGMVMVTLDSRKPGVKVPASLTGQHQVLLNFSHRFGLPDFRYDERSVSGSLSFGGQPFLCEIPWSAVWFLRSHIDETALAFPASMPPEMAQVAAQIQAAIDKAEQDEPRDEVDQDDDATVDEISIEGPPSPDDDDDPPPSGLRLVKG